MHQDIHNIDKTFDVLSKIPSGMLVFKFDGKSITQIYTNHVIAKSMGYSFHHEHNFIMESDLLHLIASKDREKMVESIKYAIINHELLDLQFSLIKKDGDFMPVHLMGSVISDEENNYLIYATLAPQSNELSLFNKISDLSKEGIYVIDLQTRDLLYANRYMTTFLKDHNYKGKKCYEALFNLKEVCPHCLTFKDCCLGKEKELYSEILDGYFAVRIEKILWGERQARVAFIRDITESKKLTIEKENIMQMYVDTLNNNPSGVLTLDVDKKTKNFEITFINQTFLSILKIDRATFDQKYAHSFFAGMHPDDLEEHRKLIKRLMEEGIPYDTTYRLLDGENNYVWLKVNTIAIDHGAYYSVYCNYLDMTELVQKNKEIEVQAQTLKLALDVANLDYWEYDLIHKDVTPSEKLSNVYHMSSEKDFHTMLQQDYACLSLKDRNKFLRAFKNIQNGSDYEEIEAQVPSTKHNKSMWARHRCFVVSDFEGKRTKVICTREDISRQKEVEQSFFTIMQHHNILSWKYDLVHEKFILDGVTKEKIDQMDNSAHTIDLASLTSSLHPDDIEKVHDCLHALKNGTDVLSVVLRFKYKDTDYSYYKIHYSVLPQDNGKREIALGSAVDVTDYMLQKNKYDEMLSLHRKKTNEKTLLNGFCNLKKDVILEMNDYTGFDLENKFGMVRDAFFVQLAQCIVNEEQRKAFLDTYLAAPLIYDFKKGITEHINTYLVDFGEGQKYIEVKVDTIERDDKDLIGFLVVTDITEETINNNVIHTITEQDFDYIGYLDIQTKKMTIVADSKNFGEENKIYNDYDTQVLKGLVPKVIEIERDACAQTNTLSGIIKGIEQNKGIYKTSYSVVNPNTKLEERKMWTFSYFDERQDKIILTRSDITPTYLAEKQQRTYLEEAVEMAKNANQSKTDFLSNMSHDIRTPMNAIVGMTDIALQNLNDKAQVEDSLRTIEQSSSHLLSIINDILDMSKIESGKSVLIQEPFDNATEYQKVVNTFKPLTQNAGLTFVHSCEFIHPTMQGDLLKMHRILDNIMSNAIKYTPKGGTIYYSFKEKPYTNPQFALCEIAVEDTGIGMDEDTLEHIYEPFHRGSLSKSSEYTGTGLGMAIVKSLVELKGGEIKIESAVGKGTKVTVSIPSKILDTKLEHPKTQDLSTVYDLTNVSVLVVEDNIPNQKVAKKMLTNLGASVTIAENGKIGVDLFTQDPAFDIILMDIQMPVMDGYQATRAIRSLNNQKAKTVPIIAMTANAFTEDIHKSLECGMMAHLPKPINVDTLYKTIIQYLKGKEDALC